MFDFIQALSYVAFVVFLLLFSKCYDIPRGKAVFLGICGMISFLLILKFLAWAENGFKGFGAENAIRAYIFLPLVMWGLARLGKVKVLPLFDLFGLGCLLGYGVGHYACIFAGCCHGFRYYEGTPMYKLARALTGTDMLPMQFLESTSALLLFFILCLVAWKKRYQTNGRMLCLWFICFGSQRFLWEFLRDNNKVIKIVPLTQSGGYFGISNLAIWSLLMVVAGLIIYKNIRLWEKKTNQ